jgi:predicted RecA/RadA family phage recombinase
VAKNRKSSGSRVKFVSASANITSGTFVAQEGWWGIALDTVASGASGWLAVEGEWNIAVPASTVLGDILYAPSSAGVITESGAAITLSRTASNANVPVCKATSDRTSGGYANVILGAQIGAKAGTQV